jgi:hypothetical protein
VLTIQDVNDHPGGPEALQALGESYAVAEIANGLLLTQRNADLRLFLYDIDDVLGAAQRHAACEAARTTASSGSAKRYAPEDIISGAPDLESARRMIAQLEHYITQLRANSKAAEARKERWRLRALLAEEKLSHLSDGAPSADDRRFSVLRRFLAKQLHPDNASGTDTEKLIRAEIFKQIWSEVGRIEGR